jgi:hypothetical protein
MTLLLGKTYIEKIKEYNHNIKIHDIYLLSSVKAIYSGREQILIVYEMVTCDYTDVRSMWRTHIFC